MRQQNLPLGQTITVAKSNGQFKSVQAALDSITDAASDKWYEILLYPGIYEENVVGKNYVGLLGMGSGSEDNIVIKSTSGVTFTAPNLESSINNIVLRSTPTANGAVVYKATAGGVHNVFTMFLEMESSTNGITGKIAEIASDSQILWARNNFNYIMTGSSAGSNTHKIIDVSGTASFISATAANIVTIGDVDDDVEVISFDSTGNFIAVTWFTIATATNGAYTGIFKYLAIHKDSSTKFPTQNILILTGNGSGTGYAIYMDTATDDGVMDSGFNNYLVAGFANNYYAHADTGDTINSNVDVITAIDHETGAGQINFNNSNEYGQVDITGGGEITIDTVDEWQAFTTLSTGISSDNITLEAGSTGVITDTSNNGGVLRVTDVDHGLSTGVYITLTGMGDAAHNGVTRVTVINSSTFDCDDITFNSIDDTGNWNHGSHIVVNHRGAYRIDYAFSASSAGANKIFDFVVFDGTTQVAGTKIKRKFSAGGDVGAFAGSGIVSLEVGGHLFFAMRNTTDATDITISEGAFNISKVN